MSAGTDSSRVVRCRSVVQQFVGPALQHAASFKLLPLEDYDIIAVNYSGGKDSLACLLHLLDLGVPRSKIERNRSPFLGAQLLPCRQATMALWLR
jgi:hypothetical protein